MKGLQEGIGVRVENVSLETRVDCPIVKAEISDDNIIYSPKVKVFNTKSRILDLDLAIVLWNFALGGLGASVRISAPHSHHHHPLSLAAFRF